MPLVRQHHCQHEGREGEEGKNTTLQMGPISAPTVLHRREVRAAKVSSLPHSDIQKSFDFLCLRKILTQGIFPVCHGEPWEEKTHYSHSAALAHRGYGGKCEASLAQPCKPQRLAAQGLPKPQAASAAAALAGLHGLLSY